MNFHNQVLEESLKTEEAYLKARCIDSSELFINFNKTSLQNILTRLARIENLSNLYIIDNVKDENGEASKLIISCILGEEPKSSLVNIRTKEVTAVRYCSHPVLDFVLEKTYRTKLLH